jgi:hypothetical protein
MLFFSHLNGLFGTNLLGDLQISVLDDTVVADFGVIPCPECAVVLPKAWI